MISAMPMASGRPICTGAPCTEGKREVIWIARIASPGAQRPHGDDERPCKRTRRHALDIGPVHRHVRTARDMTQFDPVLDQRLLERKEAAQSKADQVVTPDVKEIEGFLDQFAAAPN